MERMTKNGKARRRGSAFVQAKAQRVYHHGNWFVATEPEKRCFLTSSRGSAKTASFSPPIILIGCAVSQCGFDDPRAQGYLESAKEKILGKNANALYGWND